MSAPVTNGLELNHAEADALTRALDGIPSDAKVGLWREDSLGNVMDGRHGFLIVEVLSGTYNARDAISSTGMTVDWGH